MKAVIFGANGQDGYYLNELLSQNKIDVVGVSRSGGKWEKGDVGDMAYVSKLIKKCKPDYIFHFAAISSTKHEAIFDNHRAIGTGTLNILESVKNFCPVCRVFLSGSALQFENKGLPIDEETPFAATSPYAVERIASVYASRYFRKVFGLNVYVGYFFNHDSPLRTTDFINQKIVSAVKRIANGSEEKIKIGDLNAKKEFNFAGDIVEAVWQLVNQSKIYEAVIGSGKVYSIRDWLKYCFAKNNKNWKEFTEVEPNFKPEYKVLVSNPKLIKSIGWRPKMDFFQLADMMMETSQ
jgi:GDPmannose 4,6-dehydratase